MDYNVLVPYARLIGLRLISSSGGVLHYYYQVLVVVLPVVQLNHSLNPASTKNLLIVCSIFVTIVLSVVVTN